jgi:hypothetical protein
MYIFLRTLPFCSAERLCSLELGLKCGREEKAQIRAFSVALSALAFFVLFFLRAFLLFFILVLMSMKV